MWNPLRHVRRDHEGHERAKKAASDAESMVEKIDTEIRQDKLRAQVLREIRERNHLAELFDEAFSMRRREEGR